MSITPNIQCQPLEEEEEDLQAKPLPGQFNNMLQKQEEEEEELIQAKRVSGRSSGVTDQLQANIQSLCGGGRPLNDSVRGFFEPRFGHDFSRVRVHTDSLSAMNARALSARAYTVGHDVAFGAGQYAPGTLAGQKLLAHELTHVVQQGQSFPHTKPLGKATPRMAGMPPDIQRAVTYTGVTVTEDINPLDPTTAPSGNQTAIGHTALHVNGQDVQSLSDEQKINMLFPLPTTTTNWGDCVMSNRNLNVRTENQVRILTPAPWTRTLPKSDLGTIMGGGLGGNPACGGTGNTTVTLTGNPNDQRLINWARQGEMQHATDDECIVDRYIKGYEADVNALPNSFPRGYWGFGSCDARLEERLRRRERATAFFQDWAAFTSSYDGPGGSHVIRASTSVGQGCSSVTVTIGTGPLPPQSRNCTQWSPP